MSLNISFLYQLDINFQGTCIVSLYMFSFVPVEIYLKIQTIILLHFQSTQDEKLMSGSQHIHVAVCLTSDCSKAYSTACNVLKHREECKWVSGSSSEIWDCVIYWSISTWYSDAYLWNIILENEADVIVYFNPLYSDTGLILSYWAEVFCIGWN